MIYVSETIKQVSVAGEIDERVHTVDCIYRHDYATFRSLYPQTFIDMTEDEFNERKFACYCPPSTH